MSDATLFAAALGEADRAAYLAAACDDPGQRRRVEALLAAHDQAAAADEEPPDEPIDFLDPPMRPDSIGRLGHYEVLGVARHADDAEIRRAYLDRARRNHPDAAGGDAEAMLRVNEAWSVPGDPASRAAYDARLEPEGRAFAHRPAAAPFVPYDTTEDEADDWRFEPDVGDPRTAPGRRVVMAPTTTVRPSKETMADTASDAGHKRRIGLYPGTFDPVTNGHLDIIGRAARQLDKLVVWVAINSGKGPMFSLEERVELVTAEIAPIADKHGMVIEVMPFDTLLIDFARKVGASMIVRGLRARTGR